MLHLRKSLTKMAVLALTVSMLAAGCSDAGKKPANNKPAGNASNETATEQPAVNPATEQPAATEKPAATAKPTQKPTQKPSQKPTLKPSATPKPSSDIKVSDISAKILKDIEMPRLVTVEGERIKDVYGIDSGSLLSEAVFMQALMNTKATELVIVKLKSDKNYDAVAEALENRAASIQKTFETYLQDQYEDAQNYKIVRSGSYVMLSISHDQDKVVEIFNGFFK
ncbi:DUF4358 domain-containing protein [Bacillus sp. FJAT-26390]|uniref:DUF4358 domain-containing protein n=1 Tax=Bacillus sp. FJAT-26390 TaxID=1743142 RepID=UPI000807DA38|nr:DUF4358 domain-containing protein [Bacillus sp. FJAT-26390]OBZ15187.1 hypothetical protein A7975_32430 [Bacillus sp. FJAT-26390]